MTLTRDEPIDPDYKSTRTYIKWAIGVGAVLAIACMASGATIIALGRYNVMFPWEPLELSDQGVEFGQFGMTLVITFCMDGLGYAHSISYRSLLEKHGKLNWNHNLRLFDHSSKDYRHGYWMNSLWAVCIMLVYTSTQVLFIRSIIGEFDDHHGGEHDKDHAWTVNGMALLSLRFGLFGQVTVAALCL